MREAPCGPRSDVLRAESGERSRSSSSPPTSLFVTGAIGGRRQQKRGPLAAVVALANRNGYGRDEEEEAT
jgi:hypothetical protein